MFNSIFKEIKKNILYMKNNLLVFIKLIKFDYIINIVYFIIMYDFLTYIDKNSTFIYSFLSQFFSYLNPLYNLFTFLLFYFLISIRSIVLLIFKNNFKSSNTKFDVKKVYFNSNNYLTNNNYNGILLQLLYSIYNIVSFKVVFSYLMSWYSIFFKYTLNNFFVFRFILNSLQNFTKVVSWYPIFKRHSVFGYYRINRQRWVELKSEEINYIKY